MTRAALSIEQPQIASERFAHQNPNCKREICASEPQTSKFLDGSDNCPLLAKVHSKWRIIIVHGLVLPDDFQSMAGHKHHKFTHRNDMEPVRAMMQKISFVSG